MKLSLGSVFNILHRLLRMKKLCARWLSRLLTIDQKQPRVSDSETNLELFRRSPNEFLRLYVTLDEI